MLKSKIKSNQLFDWLFSFWKDADTKDEIVHWHNGNSKGISYLYDWTANGYENKQEEVPVKSSKQRENERCETQEEEIFSWLEERLFASRLNSNGWKKFTQLFRSDNNLAVISEFFNS